MGRNMHLWRFGHFGMPVIVFPTAAGFAHEWKSQGMIDALADLIGAGKIKLYCPESNVSEAWTRKESDPAWRIGRHKLYEQWVMEVLVPYIRKDCNSPNIPIGVTGSSLGGMYAANFALKFPETFQWSLAMSGRYEVRNFTNGYDSPDVYYNNPLAFVPNLAGEDLLRLRNTHITLVCGQGKWEEGCIEETRALAHVFRKKGIPHTEDIWGTDVRHDWEWWRRQARFHFLRSFR
ncbi:MAG: esterase family protein [Alphaproteobacteria bacterium]|nr:esterase family protein [Alphaproteobacteria bacterium]